MCHQDGEGRTLDHLRLTISRRFMLCLNISNIIRANLETPKLTSRPSARNSSCGGFSSRPSRQSQPHLPTSPADGPDPEIEA